MCLRIKIISGWLPDFAEQFSIINFSDEFRSILIQVFTYRPRSSCLNRHFILPKNGLSCQYVIVILENKLLYGGFLWYIFVTSIRNLVSI